MLSVRRPPRNGLVEGVNANSVPPGVLEPVDQEILDEVARGFDTVGDLIAHHRQKAGIAEDYVKDRWQPLALLGVSGTAFAVLGSLLGKKRKG